MMDNDFGAIPPVENVQNVAALTPLGQRQDSKRRPSRPRPDPKHNEATPEKAAQDQADRHDDSPVIDYCA